MTLYRVSSLCIPDVLLDKAHVFTAEKRYNKADRPANSREQWAGALMEVRSLFLVVTDGRTDGWTYRQTGL